MLSRSLVAEVSNHTSLQFIAFHGSANNLNWMLFVKSISIRRLSQICLASVTELTLACGLIELPGAQFSHSHSNIDLRVLLYDNRQHKVHLKKIGVEILPLYKILDIKVHGAYMGPTWGRQDPGGPHVGPMNLAIRDILYSLQWFQYEV